MNKNDDSTELKEATPEQLLEAACNFYKRYNPDAERYIRLGFKLSQKNGWKEVALAWLKNIKEENR